MGQHKTNPTAIAVKEGRIPRYDQEDRRLARKREKRLKKWTEFTATATKTGYALRKVLEETYSEEFKKALTDLPEEVVIDDTVVVETDKPELEVVYE